ncbi:MAG: class I SAM-dependent methyltransferase [Candidatus Thorarchaeota archaeon SMTZ1-45]
MNEDLPDALKESGAIEVRWKLGDISGGDVLDVGTDNGDFIKVLMKTFKEYSTFTGVDISDEELDKARERFKDDPVEFMVMNAESLTFDDEQFDTVCMSYTIHHLENIDTVLAEMYRVLKPGGHFIIQEMYSDGNQTAAQLVDLDVHHLDVKADTLLGVPHFESLTRQDLRNSFERIGLNDIEYYESSWSVKCLFCDDAPECENPTRADNIEFVIKQIDESLAKVSDHASYDILREEAESLKKRVKIHGSSAASLMYLFGRK